MARFLRLASLVPILAVGLSVPALAADCGPHVPRLRPVDRDLVSMISDGCRRSPTFKQLVDELERSDVFVCVEETREVPASMQAFMQLAGASGKYRYMRIVLKLPASTDMLIARLGHELQHIAEVSRAHAVRDQAAMEAFYRSIGDDSGAGWDTPAARAAGRQVLDELRHAIRADITHATAAPQSRK